MLRRSSSVRRRGREKAAIELTDSKISQGCVCVSEERMIAVIFTILANSVAFLFAFSAPLRPSKFPRGESVCSFTRCAVHVANAEPKRSAPLSTLKTAFLLPPPSLLQRPSVSLARSFQTARPTGLVVAFYYDVSTSLKEHSISPGPTAGGNINRNNADARARRGHSSSPGQFICPLIYWWLTA